MNTGQNRQLEKYLSQIDSYLSYMPILEKTDILSELKSSFYERINNGQSVESIITEFGTPRELAISYMGELIEKQSFSIKSFMMIFSFYLFAPMMWMSIIPIFALLSIGFFFSSIMSILFGIMGFLKGIFHISLIDNLKILFFKNELSGIPALLYSWLFAFIFILFSFLCWKVTLHLIRFLQLYSWKLKNRII